MSVANCYSPTRQCALSLQKGNVEHQLTVQAHRAQLVADSSICTDMERGLRHCCQALQAALKQDEFVLTTAHAHNSSKRFQLMVSAVNAKKTGDAIVSEQPCVSEEPVAYQPLCT
eukprot:17832-Heterococcus_DN1.PRE.5